MKRIIPISFLLCLCGHSLSATPPPSLRSWEDPQYVEEAFVEVAFKREYGAGSRYHRLNRWKVPIYYQIDYYRFDPDGFRSSMEKAIHGVFAQLAMITRHPIRPADEEHPPNFTVTLTRYAHYKSALQTLFGRNTLKAIRTDLASTTNCTGRYTPNRRGEIYRGQVIIPVDHTFRKGLFLSCVTEEITQLMGMPNDADWIVPSLANDSNPQLENISPLDYLFLKLLYSNTLRAGMDIRQARPLIRMLLKQWKQNRVLQQAPQRMMSIRNLSATRWITSASPDTPSTDALLSLNH